MVKINNYEFTIGADPEFFVARRGKPVSAHGLVPGDKKKPFKVAKGAVQVDGMALEFNIDPAKNEKEFLSHLDVVMKTIMDMVPGYDFYNAPVADFGFDYIQKQPDEAKMLGCDPDFNAYTKQANPRPNGDAPFRTAAGHVHIGWTKDVDPFDPGHFEACCMLTKALDRTLGLPSLIWDQDQKRRELYGQAGAFRPKPYGMEYRTLSNAWLSPERPYLRSCVFNNTVKAITDLFNDEKITERDVFGKKVQDIINLGDLDTVLSEAAYNTNNTFYAPKKFREGFVAPEKAVGW